MQEREDRLGLRAIFAPDADLHPLRLRLNRAGIQDEQISLLSSVPLEERSGSDSKPFWPYVVTIAAGLVGIGVGVFFAAGTAALYPLMTGGKPIVGAPIVGIVSYETMMLLAIVATFLTMVLRIRRAHRGLPDREARIHEGKLVLSIQPLEPGQESVVKRLFEAAGAEDIRVIPHDVSFPDRQAAGALAVLALLCAAAGCSQDMQEQPSYRSQEAPRLHSPPGSIPRDSRALISRHPPLNGRTPEQGQDLYRVNCLPCHGQSGKGTGPVAAYLKELPADLLAPRIGALSEDQLYDIITNGKDMMPSFRGELSATERMAIASFVRTMDRTGIPSQP